MMKTPLRYPGGKSRAVKHILPHIPEDIDRLCSPFFGGGSVELAVASRGTEVRGYDKMKQLVWFWMALSENNNRLADEVQNLREQYQIRNGDVVTGCSKESFHQYREDLKTESFMFSYERAAKYYAINRASFSGATFSGGWSEKASYARFTDSSVQRLRDFEAKNFRVDYADFEDAIYYHPKAFLYLDPPYMLPTTQNALYGTNGDLHRSFDHERLYSILTKRTGWVMSYNNSKTIKKMYEGYEIIDAEWAYGMKNVATDKMGASSEILIIGR
jgi:DNA adenine methylase